MKLFTERLGECDVTFDNKIEIFYWNLRISLWNALEFFYKLQKFITKWDKGWNCVMFADLYDILADIEEDVSYFHHLSCSKPDCIGFGNNFMTRANSLVCFGAVCVGNSLFGECSTLLAFGSAIQTTCRKDSYWSELLKNTIVGNYFRSI